MAATEKPIILGDEKALMNFMKSSSGRAEEFIEMPTITVIL